MHHNLHYKINPFDNFIAILTFFHCSSLVLQVRLSHKWVNRKIFLKLQKHFTFIINIINFYEKYENEMKKVNEETKNGSQESVKKIKEVFEWLKFR